jgi:hypothetical protein
MISYLDRLRRELEDAAGDAGAEVSPPPEGKWSASQILEHLFLTYKHTNRGLDKCLDQGSTLATRATLKQRFGAFLVLTLGYLPGGRKAPERTQPRGMAPQEARTTIASELETMGKGLDACERKFGADTKILDHPFLGPLTAAQWRKFHWVHGRHHARQIRERLGKT